MYIHMCKYICVCMFMYIYISLSFQIAFLAIVTSRTTSEGEMFVWYIYESVLLEELVVELWGTTVGCVFISPFRPLLSVVSGVLGWALFWLVGRICGDQEEWAAISILRMVCSVCVHPKPPCHWVNSQQQLTEIPWHSLLLGISLLWCNCGSGPDMYT